MSFLERFLVWLFANQYCESDLAYIVLLIIMIYVTWTFLEGIIPEIRDIVQERQLICEDDPYQKQKDT